MKKKILAITLCVAMLAIMLVSGTLAYFTDTDAATNVMEVGGVAIEQIEQERGENGLIEFTPNKPIVPAVGEIEWDEDRLTVGDYEYKVFDDELKNVVDKIVTVQNTGKSDAYVRTIVAIEAPDYDPDDLIHVNVNNNEDVLSMTAWTPVDIDGVQYVYAVFTYNKALAPQETSAASLLQVFLDSKTTNEDVAAYGDTWEILVLSQAAQEAGFPDAATALNEAFGEATAANVAAWF